MWFCWTESKGRRRPPHGNETQSCCRMSGTEDGGGGKGGQRGERKKRLTRPFVAPSPLSQSDLRRNEHPSVSRARPPVGVHRTAEQDGHTTTVCELEKTVVIAKQPWHLTSMKKLFGDCTSRFSLCFRFS